MNRQLGNDRRPAPVSPYQQRAMANPYEPVAFSAPAEFETESAPFFTFGEMFGALWNRRWLVIALVGICVVGALAIAYSQPPVYQAKALIEIQGVNENFLNRRELDPTQSEGGVMLEPYIQTQIKLVQTDGLLGRTADRLQLDSLPEFQPKVTLSTRLKQRFGLSAKSAPADPRQGVLAVVAHNLTVRLAGETHIVEVAYESTNPQTAAAVANTLAQEYVAQNLEKQLSATQYTGKWLTGQLQDLRKTLDQSERELQDYVKTHGLLASTDSSKTGAEDGRLRQLETAYSTAREARIAEQSRYELVANAPMENLSDVIDSDTVRGYQIKLNDLKQKLAEARAIYTPAHYKVREIQAQVDEVQHALEHERKAVVSRLRNQFEASSQREKLLGTDLNAQTSLVTGETADAVKYNRLKRAVETYSRLYDGTLSRVKETDLASAVRANNVQIAESAKPPMAPVRPSKPLYGALGMICGLLLGSISALHLDRRNRLVNGHAEFGMRMGIPEFGPIPCASIELPFSVKSEQSLTKTRAYKVEEGVASEEDDILRDWLEVVTWRQRGSMLAESYRNTLASLMHSVEGEAPRVIVFTSACAGEGKTTVATNLGIALAESGRKVLLIDADRRRPRLHEVFNCPNEYGLSEFLADPLPMRSVNFATLTKRTSIPGLRVLPAGMDHSCAPTLVHNRRMADLLVAARQEFDTILVDTPPMMALADARGVGSMADGVALVIRAQRTPEQLVMTASDRLRQDGIRILGTILNSWKPEKRFGRNYYESAASYTAAAYRRD